MRVVVEVRQVENVDSEGAEDCDPGWLIIQRIAIAQLFVEVRVEVAGHDLVAGHGLENIVMCISEDGLTCGPIVPGVQVVVDSHALLGPGRRVVEGVIVRMPS